MTAALAIRSLSVSYGSIPAVRAVDLEVMSGEIRVILGANGAGKTSILKAVLGLVKASSDQLDVDGEPIRGVPPHIIKQRGVSWVPEGRLIWSTLTVTENLRMGWYLAPSQSALEERMEEMFARFPLLGQRRSQLAGTLSGGEQQWLAIGRALMSSPRLLLLDEPSLGLAPLAVRDVFAAIKSIQSSGISVLMVEQNARQALRVADWAYLLENGRIAGSGPAQQMALSEEIQRVYLGG